jgi:vesicle coat complex subunit
VGEYAELVENADKIVEKFQQTFLEDPDQVKLSLLTAAVKLYVKVPHKSETIIQTLLKTATEEADNPDLRDRAYIYWRMLSTNPAKTADVVLGSRPNIASDSYDTYSDEFIEELLSQISTVCSIYHLTPEDMTKQFGITKE